MKLPSFRPRYLTFNRTMEPASVTLPIRGPAILTRSGTLSQFKKAKSGVYLA